MSVQTIEAAAHHLKDAETALKQEMATAHNGGVALAKIARAAGVALNTARRWINEANQASE